MADLHFRYNLFSISFTHSLKVQFLTRKNLLINKIGTREATSDFEGRTNPSVFRRTLRMNPKEPLPITSRGSYSSRNVEEDMKEKKWNVYVSQKARPGPLEV